MPNNPLVHLKIRMNHWKGLNSLVTPYFLDHFEQAVMSVTNPMTPVTHCVVMVWCGFLIYITFAY